MRILILPKDFPSPERAHPGAFVLRDVKALKALGHDVQVIRIVPHAPPIGKWRRYTHLPADQLVDDIPVKTLRAVIPPQMIGLEFVAPQVQNAVLRTIVEFQPDVLHAHFLLPAGHVAVRQPIPVVLTAHGSDAYHWPYRRRGLYRAAREAIMCATEVTAVSGFIRDCVQRIAFRDVHVVHNGADDCTFYPRDAARCRADVGLPADRVIVAYAGNLLRTKGLFDLIAAVARLPVEKRPFLAVAGGGPERGALQLAARDSAVELRLLDVLPSTGVARLFAAADIVTLPSHNEGLPNVVCEAMACERPVLATTVGGIPEIVADGRTGLLVPPHDVAALAAALARLVNSDEDRRRMGLAARAFAVANVVSSVTARRYESIYAKAIHRFGMRERRAPIPEGIR